MSVFLDSSAIIGYYHSRDKHHKEAVDAIENAFEKYALVYISDYILDESLTVTWMRTREKDIALKLGERLLFSEINLLVVTRKIIENVWSTYQKENNPSFTDCTTLELMRINGIQNIITFDRWFKSFKDLHVIP